MSWVQPCPTCTTEVTAEDEILAFVLCRPDGGGLTSLPTWVFVPVNTDGSLRSAITFSTLDTDSAIGGISGLAPCCCPIIIGGC